MKRWIGLLFLSVKTAYALGNVQIIPFQSNQIVPLHAHTFMVTQIQFGKEEKIVGVQNGDVAAWTVDIGKQFPNTLFIKPTIANSNTNMTVLTNQHTYYFHIMSEEKQDSSAAQALYALKFRYPDEMNDGLDKSSVALPEIKHWNYSFHGSAVLKPLHVFDDGHFTYFQMQKNQILPAIFAVNSRLGNEAVVNFRREGDYLVVHQMAPQFTLRRGKGQVASIFNDDLIRRMW